MVAKNNFNLNKYTIPRLNHGHENFKSLSRDGLK